MGLAVLCRPTFLPWLGLVALGMLLVRGRIANCKLQNANCKLGWADVGWRVANCAALVLVAGAVVSPWVVRNQRVFGKPIITTTHGGYTLYLGNNPEFFAYLQHSEHSLPWVPSDKLFLFHPYAVPPSRHFELGEDQLLYAAAKETIRQQPVTFLRACLHRIGQLWSPLPNRLTAEESTGRRLMRYAVAVWYCGVYLLAAAGAWRLRGRLLKSPWVWGVLLCVVFTGVHTLYWSNLRMRAPLMPFVACVAAAAMAARQEK
jgi:hypothetical protein